MKNPYIDFGAQLKTSLDYVIANLPVSPTFEDLNQQLVDSIYIINPSEGGPLNLVVPILKTVLPNVYNGYFNVGGRRLDDRGLKTAVVLHPTSDIGHQTPDTQQLFSSNTQYSTEQQYFIDKFTESVLIVQPLQLGEYLSRLEEDVVQSGLNFEQQTPLLLALALGKASNEYWLNQITVFAAWGPYLNAESFINYANLPHWVSATMLGSLIAYGLVRPPHIGFADMFVSTVAATGLVAGKVIFNWLGAN